MKIFPGAFIANFEQTSYALHASPLRCSCFMQQPLKGEGIQNFWESGRTLYGGT